MQPPFHDKNISKDDLAKLPLKAFLFDARFVQSRGVSCLIKIMQGTLDLQKLRTLMSFHMSKRYDLFELGIV